MLGILRKDFKKTVIGIIIVGKQMKKNRVQNTRFNLFNKHV